MIDMRLFQAILLICCNVMVMGQSYTSYFTGDTADVTVTPLKGTVLMGGATENDNAMRWFLERANGGDILVLRTTGEDGYNDYFYADLGVDVNSVETIVCNTAEASTDPYVLRRVSEADALWFAGGDQWDYVSFWRDTPMEDAFNALINDKQITIGGTSAGCAIQGEAYFSAENGTITSSLAMQDPFHALMKLGYADFLNNPATQNIITDTHYDNPDRRGRQVAFLARLVTDYGGTFYGIGIEEYTAVCIDENNHAHVYGSYPADEDYAFFLQMNCYEPATPEVCEDGEKLTWNRSEAALKVIKVAGTNSGAGYVDLNDWKTVTDATYSWENWWVENAVFNNTEAASPINCDTVLQVNQLDENSINLMVNQQQQVLIITSAIHFEKYFIRDISGKLIAENSLDSNLISIKDLIPGNYLFSATDASGKIYSGIFTK